MITPSVLLPPGGQRILVMMAHPDDAEFICGGTVARLVAEGHDVHYLLVTRGDKGNYDPDMTSERLMVIREQEQRNAAAVLGVQSVTFLEGYRDGEVEVSLTLRRALALEVRKICPDIVFSFDPWKMNEPHPDHRATAPMYGARLLSLASNTATSWRSPSIIMYWVKPTYLYNRLAPG
jgi:LmbE family N-acetylglucosaminyl deacetylase